MVVHFGFDPECITNLFSILTPMGTVVSRRIYRGCVVPIGGRETLVDLIELVMVDFDVILGMDWFHLCYAFLDCQIHKVMFKFPNDLVIEWERGSLVLKGRFISYLRARKLISKRCLYHLVWVKDFNSEDPSLHSIIVVDQFPEVFPDDLPRVPPDREIDFGLVLFRTLILSQSLLIKWLWLS